LWAGLFADEQRLADITIAARLDRYKREIGAKQPFGKAKAGASEMVTQRQIQCPRRDRDQDT